MDYKRKRATSKVEFQVSGVPDTKGASGPRVTVRPEELWVRLNGGLDGTISWIGVKGRTIRRDGQITGYRDVGWGYWGAGSHVNDPLPPAWIVDIIDREGLNWPEGWKE